MDERGAAAGRNPLGDEDIPESTGRPQPHLNIGDVTLENADLQPVLQFLARTQFGESHVAS